jgi:hypothetical protein
MRPIAEFGLENLQRIGAGARNGDSRALLVEEAPVTSAVFPERSNMSLSLLELSCALSDVCGRSERQAHGFRRGSFYES